MNGFDWLNRPRGSISPLLRRFRYPCSAAVRTDEKGTKNCKSYLKKKLYSPNSFSKSLPLHAYQNFSPKFARLIYFHQIFSQKHFSLNSLLQEFSNICIQIFIFSTKIFNSCDKQTVQCWKEATKPREKVEDWMKKQAQTIFMLHLSKFYHKHNLNLHLLKLNLDQGNQQ